MPEKYFIGWNLNKEPLSSDMLSVNVNGSTKSALPAMFVYKMKGHFLVYLDNYIKISDEDNIELLLNDKPIPDWVRPIYLVKDKGVVI